LKNVFMNNDCTITSSDSWVSMGVLTKKNGTPTYSGSSVTSACSGGSSVPITPTTPTTTSTQCIQVNDNLTIPIACAEYKSAKYKFNLDYATDLYWKLNLNTFGNSGTGNCLSVSDSLKLNIDCAEYKGNSYGFAMNYSPYPKDPNGFYWKIDLNTFVQKNPTPSLKIVDNKTPKAQEPRFIIAGNNGSYQSWTDAANNVTQALYVTDTRNTRVRTIFDAQGNPTKIIDEVTGQYVVVQAKDNNRIDYLIYDKSNHYTGGYALFEKNGKLYFGEIAGVPVFSGQLTGQMQGKTGTGSFSLIAAETSDLKNIQEVDHKYDAFINALETNGTRGKRYSLETAFKRGGYIAIVVGAIISAPIMGPALIIAGAGAIAISKVIHNSPTGASMEADAASMESGILKDTACTFIDSLKEGSYACKQKSIRSSCGDNLADTLDGVISSDPTSVANAKAAADDLKDIQTTPYTDYTGQTEPFLSSSEEPKPQDGPPTTSTNLIGQVAEQNGNVYDVIGSINPDGDIDVSGSTADGNTSIIVDGKLDNGNVSGTFTTTEKSKGEVNTGTVTGTEEKIGACQTKKGSGGQGTFTYTHMVGSGTGKLTFSYDAYSIPDAFTLSTSKRTLFTTGGLVKGGKTTELNLTDEPIVFISVTAPKKDTSWTYSIGCTE